MDVFLVWLVSAAAFVSLIVQQKRLARLERALYGGEDGRGALPRMASLEASKLLDGQRIRHLESRCCDFCRQKVGGQ